MPHNRRTWGFFAMEKSLPPQRMEESGTPALKLRNLGSILEEDPCTLAKTKVGRRTRADGEKGCRRWD